MRKPLLVFLLCAGMIACSKKEDPTNYPDTDEAYPVLPAEPFNYAAQPLPAYFFTNSGGPKPTEITAEDNMPASNPITDEGATLGRVLFYERALSKNNTISCGSCHKQQFAFGDSLAHSKGFNGGDTRRHSMGLLFARYYRRGKFFWDERAATLEQQVLMPIQDQVEMGLTLDEIQQRIAAKSYYPALFKAAFGDESITTDRISKALAQFVRSIVSYQSKYDIGREQVATPGAPFPNFTSEENAGKQIFLRPLTNGGGACFGCHTTEAFVNDFPGPTSNGLDVATTNDLGAYETTPNPKFLGAFKVPSLRGVGLRAPYMHDGRFKTLEEVVEHYNSGIQDHPNLAAALRDSTTGKPVKMNFTTAQKASLVAFLKTLDDHTLANDPKFSDPFGN